MLRGDSLLCSRSTGALTVTLPVILSVILSGNSSSKFCPTTRQFYQPPTPPTVAQCRMCAKRLCVPNRLNLKFRFSLIVVGSQGESVTEICTPSKHFTSRLVERWEFPTRKSPSNRKFRFESCLLCLF